MKKIPIHWQIILGLVLGAIFGGFFPVNKTGVHISYEESAETIDTWLAAKLVLLDSTLDFADGDQRGLIKSFRSLSFTERQQATLKLTVREGEVREYNNIAKISKPGNFVIDYVKPLGTLFLNLLKMIAIPLVLGTLIVGAASLGDLGRMARMGGKTIIFYIATTGIAITIGLVMANVIQPGGAIPQETSQELMASFSSDVAGKIQQDMEVNPMNFILSLVPTNPFDSLANAEMLPIVFFAVFFGLVLSIIPKEKSAGIVNVLDGLSEVMIKMVTVVMLIAPIGVFALMASTIAGFGFEILSTLIWYVIAVSAGLLLHMLVVYPMLMVIFSKNKLSPLQFFKGIRRAQLLAFSTSSSAATLPVTMECAERLGVKKSVGSFVLPLGATINMDGTALYQGVAALFIAQVYGIPLDLGAQITIVLTATLASVGSAPVPGVGLIMLIIVLRSVGVPEEGIALILGVDRILDMLRTMVNVTGDATASVVIATSEKAFSRS